MATYFWPEQELYSKLEISGGRISRKPRPSTQDASTPDKTTPPVKRYLPGQPRINLNDDTLPAYLQSEFLTPDLDKVAPHLWLVATQDSSHIASLTDQIVRGRHPVITENPELHLVWVNDRIYIKPLPKYLFSHAFWEFYLPSHLDTPTPTPTPTQNDAVYRAALGFVRSYAYLIQHRSDFRIATREEYALLPKGLKYADFMQFISCFQAAPDEAVSPRYHFGDLRLSRLNFWAKFFLGRFTFHKMHQQYSGQFKKYYGPLLFVFGFFSVALSAMQVVLAALEGGGDVDGDDGSRIKAWAGPFGEMSRGFSVFTLVAMLASVVFLMFVFFAHLLRELLFALGDLWGKRGGGRRGKGVS